MISDPELRALSAAMVRDEPNAADELHDWLLDRGVPQPVSLMVVWRDMSKVKGCGQFMYSCGEYIPTVDRLAVEGCEDCRKWALLRIEERRLMAGSTLRWR